MGSTTQRTSMWKLDTKWYNKYIADADLYVAVGKINPQLTLWQWNLIPPFPPILTSTEQSCFWEVSHLADLSHLPVVLCILISCIIKLFCLFVYFILIENWVWKYAPKWFDCKTGGAQFLVKCWYHPTIRPPSPAVNYEWSLHML